MDKFVYSNDYDHDTTIEISEVRVKEYGSDTFVRVELKHKSEDEDCGTEEYSQLCLNVNERDAAAIVFNDISTYLNATDDGLRREKGKDLPAAVKCEDLTTTALFAFENALLAYLGKKEGEHKMKKFSLCVTETNKAYVVIEAENEDSAKRRFEEWLEEDDRNTGEINLRLSQGFEGWEYSVVEAEPDEEADIVALKKKFNVTVGADGYIEYKDIIAESLEEAEKFALNEANHYFDVVSRIRNVDLRIVRDI